MDGAEAYLPRRTGTGANIAGGGARQRARRGAGRTLGMPVRRIAVEPTSRLAIWARRFAGFCAGRGVLLAIMIVRSGILEIVPALATFAGALVIGVIAILLALAAFVGDLEDGHRRAGRRHDGAAIGVALLAYPAYLGVKAYRLPMINDITTDPIDPPRFDAHRAAAPARRQSDRLCGPLRGRTAEGGLSGHRAADDRRDARRPPTRPPWR